MELFPELSLASMAGSPPSRREPLGRGLYDRAYLFILKSTPLFVSLFWKSGRRHLPSAASMHIDYLQQAGRGCQAGLNGEAAGYSATATALRCALKTSAALPS
eukprot:6210425-Pleurochrysis_carterae.AAC.1